MVSFELIMFDLIFESVIDVSALWLSCDICFYFSS